MTTRDKRKRRAKIVRTHLRRLRREAAADATSSVPEHEIEIGDDGDSLLG